MLVNKKEIILKEKKEMKIKGVKLNISAIAKDYGVCWSTAKKMALCKTERKKREFKGELKLLKYQEIINNKLENYRCSAISIYGFLKEKGYDGSYSLVSKYVKSKKGDLLKQATIRVETTPGLQGQVDWKEKLTLKAKNGEEYTINIFLFILSYSKYKYIELTIDRRQETLLNCLVNCFEYIGGVPEEIWFDNMKTVVDKHDVNTNKVYFNQRFAEFAKDCMFKPIACKPFRPCTKGLVENLAKIMDRLNVYNEEFDTYEELKNIIKNLNDKLNNEEKSQATNMIPNELFLQKEKEYLTKVNLNQFNRKLTREVRKVTKESMIIYNGHKYSVPVNLMDELVEFEVINNILHIYYNGEEVRKHQLSSNRFIYNKDDLHGIIKSSFPHKDEKEIEEMVEKRLKGFDILLTREDKKDE